ncbi:DUF397 domain-containing protein [Streptomyces sp. NPDC053726]|uniref:DUF397 domain-containing protein n=1 Tax=Streptomyces sp. NPDC053726 TaxID=3365713 RepID=UPI0037D5585B
MRDAQWQTSSSGRTCVQIASLDDGIAALRDSKNIGTVPSHPFTDAEYDAFIGGILRGELSRNQFLLLPWQSAGPRRPRLADSVRSSS